jgi:glycerophosphoryl diester phosphodiesterase
MRKKAVVGFLFLLLWFVVVRPMFSNSVPPVPANEWCNTDAADAMLERKQRQEIRIKDLLDRTGGDQIVLFAHRGGYTCEEKYSATEDSVANVHKAVRMGMDGYETDIWPTADGGWVSHHDSKLGRSSNGTGDVMAHTLAELRKTKLKYVQSGKLSTDGIPSLQEFLRAGDGRIIFLLQVKHGINERFTELQKIVKEVGAEENTLYWVNAYSENVDAFANYIEAGVQGIPSTVVWRVGNVEQLRDVATRIKPRMIDITLDIPYPGREEWSDETYDKYFPHDHVELVEEALNSPFIVMVSRNRTNKYMDFLYSKGIRAFASKRAEVQLQHAIATGTHF